MTTSAAALLAVAARSMPTRQSTKLRRGLGAYKSSLIASMAAKKSDQAQTLTTTTTMDDVAVNVETKIEEIFTSASRSVAKGASSANESSSSRSVAIGESSANALPGSTSSTSWTSASLESLVGRASTNAHNSVVSRSGSSTRSGTQSSNGRTTCEGIILSSCNSGT